MSKISEEKRAMIDAYAGKQGVRLDLAMHCNTVAKVDAVAKCLSEVDLVRDEFYQAWHLAPKNSKREVRALTKVVNDLNMSEEQAEQLYFEERDFIRSNIKPIKTRLVTTIIGILTDARISEKKRLLMIPIFTEELTDFDKVEASTTTPEEQKQINEFIKKLEKK